MVWVDFKNFWFFEISGSSRTKMSPNTFFYLVQNFKYYGRILVGIAFSLFWKMFAKLQKKK